jgi:3',5'-nucleoside bisphosphate phosphatase
MSSLGDYLPPLERPRGGVDLHVHTTHSDGGCSPAEVVRAAAAVGLSALAITDHDTISALAIARPEAERLGIELVNGIELTTECDGREFHILGYFIHDDDSALRTVTDHLRRARKQRLHRLVDRLHSLGLTIDVTTLERAFPRATLGRKHLADWLVRSGQVASRREVFERYLGDGGPAEVPKPRVPIREGIALIKGAGGVAGLAHPPYDLRQQWLGDLVDTGLGAIEVDGPGISARLGRRWRAWAKELDLVPTAGSDFHAADRPGRWVGSITTPAGDLELLRRALPSASEPISVKIVSGE